MINTRLFRCGLGGLFVVTIFAWTAPAQPWERWLQVPPQIPGGFRRQPTPDPPPGGTSLRYRFQARPSTLSRWADELDRERVRQEEVNRSSVPDPNQPPTFSEVSAVNEQLLDSAIQDNAPWNATLGYRLDPDLAAAVRQTQAELTRQQTPVELVQPVSSAPLMPVASMPTMASQVYQITIPQVTIISASLADRLASYPGLASQALGQASSASIPLSPMPASATPAPRP